MTITAGEDHGYQTADTIVARFWRHGAGSPGHQAGTLKGDMPTATHATVRASAEVNHGRWLVDCPFGCASAQHAVRSDRRFFCVECSNGGTCMWVPVVWPDDDQVAAIEELLEARPDPTTRNWRPGEPVDSLADENTAHGLG